MSRGFLYEGEVLRSPVLVDGVRVILAALPVRSRDGTVLVQILVAGPAPTLATDSLSRLSFDCRVA